jgi:hypothetical protein
VLKEGTRFQFQILTDGLKLSKRANLCPNLRFLVSMRAECHISVFEKGRGNEAEIVLLK